MSSKFRKPPAYRLHKPTGQAVVRLDGRDHYLGKHGTEASHEAYRRLIAEWLISPLPTLRAPSRPSDGCDLPVGDLMVAYWDRHVVPYYAKNGRPTSEVDNTRQALRFLSRLYGHAPARNFGPLALKSVRQAMIEAGRCRSLINKDVNRVRGLFRWAVEQELLPVSVYQALQAVAGLREGRSEAKEVDPVGPVPEDVVRATLPFLSAQVAAMVQFQLLTGARPGEAAMIRPRDVMVEEGGSWLYRPQEHKTEHHGRERVIVVGPRAQAILRPWMERDPVAHCFSPAEVVAGRLACEAAKGASPRQGPAAARPKPGGRYTKDSYRVAIQRACRRAGVPAWAPNQLRHTRATQLREAYGIEAAQAVLGHSDPKVTTIYAERELGRVRLIMAEVG